MSDSIPYEYILSAGKIDFMSCTLTGKLKTIKIAIPSTTRIRIQDFTNTTLENKTQLNMTINATANTSASNTAYSAKSQNMSIACWNINGGIQIAISTF